MTPPDQISAPQFQALCRLIWGEDWRPKAAEALRVNLRNVQFWAAEPPARSKPVPAGVIVELFATVERIMCADGPDSPGRLRMLAEVARQTANLKILYEATALETAYALERV